MSDHEIRLLEDYINDLGMRALSQNGIGFTSNAVTRVSNAIYLKILCPKYALSVKEVINIIANLTNDDIVKWKKLGISSQKCLHAIQKMMKEDIERRYYPRECDSIYSKGGFIKYFKYPLPEQSQFGLYDFTRESTESVIMRYAIDNHLSIESCSTDGIKGIWVVFKKI